MKMTLHNQIIP